MQYTFTEHITAIYLRLCVYLQIAKDVLFILKKRSNTMLVMQPFSQQLETQANEITGRIQKAVPMLRVRLLGSAGLKIYGKRDIDIYVECPPAMKKMAIKCLSDLLGIPSQTGAITGWSYKQNNTEVEIVLIDPRSQYYQTHVFMMNLLANNHEYRSRYISLKKKHNHLPRKIYSRNKTLFINSILLRHTGELVSHLIQQRHEMPENNTLNGLQTKNKTQASRTKPTVMVGITAYNEEKNINRLLSQIISQTHRNYSLSNIIVVSDASMDMTDVIVSKFPDNRVALIRNSKNIGKTGSVLQLHKQAKQIGVDITVLIDADIYMPDTSTLEHLIQPLIDDDAVMTVSGDTRPLPSQGYIEGIAYFVDTVSRETYRRSLKDTNYYKCTDQLIALRTSDYTHIHMKNRTFLHDGAYYLLTVMAKRKFLIADKAVAYYQLPTVLREYVSQMNRFLLTDQQIGQEFSLTDIGTYVHITSGQKLGSFVRLAFRHPFIACGCMCIHGYIYLRRILGMPISPYRAAWNTQQSTRFPRTINRLPIIRTIRDQSKCDTFSLVIRQESCGVKYVEKTYHGLFFMPIYRYLSKESTLTDMLRHYTPGTRVTVPNVLYAIHRLTSFTVYYEYVEGTPIHSMPEALQIQAYTTVRQWSRQYAASHSDTLIPKRQQAYFIARIIPLWISAMALYPNHIYQWTKLFWLFIQGIPTFPLLRSSIIHGDLSPENMIKNNGAIYLLDISIMSVSYDIIEPIRILTNNGCLPFYKQFAGRTISWNKNAKALAAYCFLADVVFNHEKGGNIPKIDTLIHTYLYT